MVHRSESPTETRCCEECGRADAVRVGEAWLCLDCYAIRGSCCAEFQPAGEDLEQLENDRAP